MNKRGHFLLFLLLVIMSLMLAINFAHSQSSVGIGLQLTDTSGPFVRIIRPLNNSGFQQINITFFYNVSDASAVDSCSLIINNKINMTQNSITKDVNLNFRLNNTALGIYNWSINCTDSLGFGGFSGNRTFSVLFITKFNGTVTNLSMVNITNVTNFVIHTSSLGKINFSTGVDLSEGFDLDSYINISFNRIELNSSALPNLNVSATLQLEGLAFSNPRILVDGELCPSSICKKISYSGGVLVFNVSHFTTYTSEETPSETPSPAAAPSGGGSSGGGSGGGGGGPPAVPITTDFTIDKTAIKVVLKQGQSKTETFKIKNIGTSIFDVKAILSEIERFKTSPEANELTTLLSPDEEKTIELVFKALENEKPDIYPSKISLKGPSTQKDIETVVEIDSAEPLFDVDVEVLPDSKKVFSGDELHVEVNLFNVRGFGRVDVNVEYAIKDFKGNTVAAEHETLAVETQAKFTRSLLVPSDLRPGNYVALVKVIYGDSIGTSSDIFEVKAKAIRLYPIQIKGYKTVLLIAGGVLLIGIIIFSAYRVGYVRKKRPKTEVEEIKQLRDEEKAQKLRKELEALENAYKSGLISEESYKNSKKRVEDKLK